MWKKISCYYPPWLELIPVILFIFVLIYTATHYALLPEKIPTHFGAAGFPDAWSQKGFWSVYMVPAIVIIIWLSMVLVNYFFIIKPDDPGKIINLPQRQKERLGPDQIEAIRTFTARGMLIINLTLAAMLATLQYGFINTALRLQRGLGFSMGIFAAMLVIESVGLAAKTVSMTSTLKTRA